jgi:hypothetical protein
MLTYADVCYADADVCYADAGGVRAALCDADIQHLAHHTHRCDIC